MPRRKVSFVNNAKERIGDGFDYSKDRVMEAKDSVDDFVRKNPTTSILISAAVGALVALGVNALVGRYREPKSFMEKLRDRFY